MKTSILTLGTIIALIAGCTFLLSCGSNSQKDAETQEQHDMDSDQEDMQMTAKASCPMHPEITGKEGDKCSKCGMALVLNESTEHEDGEHAHEN